MSTKARQQGKAAESAESDRGPAPASGIRRVGIVGAGTMGRRIAFGCIVRGKEVRLHDVSLNSAEQAVRWVLDLIDSWVNEGKLSATGAQTARAGISIAASLRECVAGADLVVEAVPEDTDIKRRVFYEIDRHIDERTLIATNASSIPGSRLADAVRRPEHFINMNFSHVHHLKVEVMGHPGTEPAVFDRAIAFVRELRLVPIPVRGEVPGYATNRVWRAVKKEVLHLLDRGQITAEDIDRAWMLDWGTLIGPCGLMDRIGLDVVRDIEMIYYRESGNPSDRPPRLLEAMIDAGKLGEKSGEGFYTYPNPAYTRARWLTGEDDPLKTG